jgi:hypothetical protein
MRTYDPVLKCVAFFGIEPPSGGVQSYGGTGFFLLHRGRLFIVTAGHCAREIQASRRSCVLRIGATVCNVGFLDWRYHSDRAVDVAVVPCTSALAAGLPISEFMPFGPGGFLTDDKRLSKNIGPGDQVGIVGLYSLRPGAAKNLPIVHTGHIAMLPDASEPLEIADPTAPGQKLWHSPYLIEAQSLRGLSGAPVFVRRSLRLNLKDAPNEEFMAYGSLWLLGLWHGAWQLQPDPILAEDRGLAPAQRVPVGVGVAISSDKIIETMDYVLNTDPPETLQMYVRTHIGQGPPAVVGTSVADASGASMPFYLSHGIAATREGANNALRFAPDGNYSGALGASVLMSGVAENFYFGPDFAANMRHAASGVSGHAITASLASGVTGMSDALLETPRKPDEEKRG